MRRLRNRVRAKRVRDSRRVALDTSRVASGVTSRGVRPVPPVVRTTRASVASPRSASAISSRSSGTRRRTTSYPSSRRSCSSRSPLRSSRVPATTPSETVSTAAFRPAPSSSRAARTSATTISLSIAFAMSYTVSAATAAAVSASISTPVCAVVSADATISTELSRTSSVTSTWESCSGWQSGISSLVRLAAMIPATCAVASASPFGSSRSRRAVSAAIRTSARATARRRETGFLPTSTMRTSPASSTCESSLTGPATSSQRARARAGNATRRATARCASRTGRRARRAASAPSPRRRGTTRPDEGGRGRSRRT